MYVLFCSVLIYTLSILYSQIKDQVTWRLIPDNKNLMINMNTCFTRTLLTIWPNPRREEFACPNIATGSYAKTIWPRECHVFLLTTLESFFPRNWTVPDNNVVAFRWLKESKCKVLWVRMYCLFLLDRHMIILWRYQQSIIFPKISITHTWKQDVFVKH